MGLKQDLIDAKLEGLRMSGAAPDAIAQAMKPGSVVEMQSELEKEAIVNFLTQCEFKVTKLNANVILDDFKIPDHPVNLETNTLVGDKAPIIDIIKKLAGLIPGGNEVVVTLEQALKQAVEPLTEAGATLPVVDVGKDGGETGLLESTGYVYIGEDPESQQGFDVEDEDGQREYTTVKLFREDIEEFL
jgi:hypothetical protein